MRRMGVKFEADTLAREYAGGVVKSLKDSIRIIFHRKLI